MPEWKEFKDEWPVPGNNSFGRPKQFLVGGYHPFEKYFAYKIACFRFGNRLEFSENGLEVNTTFFTHWMEIPGLPEVK